VYETKEVFNIRVMSLMKKEIGREITKIFQAWTPQMVKNEMRRTRNSKRR
jgi:hypothetical protein